MSTEPSDDDIATAFEDLRREVSLVRAAVEGLTAARERIPDYAPTLAAMTDRLDASAEWMRRVAETPLLRLTPAQMGQDIQRVAEAARREDREALDIAKARIAQAVQGLEQVTEQAWSANDQWRAQCITGCICLLVGMMIALALYDVERWGNIGQMSVATGGANPASGHDAHRR